MKTKGGSNAYAYSRHHTFTRCTSSCEENHTKSKKLLTERIEGDSHWNFDIKVDLMIGSAEDVHESVDKAAQLRTTITGIMSSV